MVHTAKNPTLSRKAASRKALLVNLSNALLQRKRITTTLAKAKALARFFAPIITQARARSKEDVNHAYRQAFAILCDKKSVKILFNEVLFEIKERPGGYTRIIKLGRRKGDGAYTALIELVDFNTLLQKTKKVKTRRGRKRKIEKERVVPLAAKAMVAPTKEKLVSGVTTEKAKVPNAQKKEQTKSKEVVVEHKTEPDQQ